MRITLQLRRDRCWLGVGYSLWRACSADPATSLEWHLKRLSGPSLGSDGPPASLGEVNPTKGTSAIKVETCGVRVPGRTVDSIRCRNGLCIDEAGGEVPFQDSTGSPIPYSHKGKLVFRAIILSVGILSLSMDIVPESASRAPCLPRAHGAGVFRRSLQLLHRLVLGWASRPGRLGPRRDERGSTDEHDFASESHHKPWASERAPAMHTGALSILAPAVRHRPRRSGSRGPDLCFRWRNSSG